ncbi:MAG: sulfatase-like hydrolase/transferase [Pirellulaceae bacterium]
MIVVDDLNVGAAAGPREHPSPSRRGGINAHCQHRLNSSRTVCHRPPHGSGLAVVRFRLAKIKTLQWFQEAIKPWLPARSFTASKPRKSEPPEFETWGPVSAIGPTPDEKLVPPTPAGNHPLVDWGTFPHRDEDKGDYQIASWAIDQINTLDNDKPFLMSFGFFLPHVPCYATKRWFDLYPENKLRLPNMVENDRDDTPDFSWYLHWSLPEPRLSWLRENNQHRNLVRSYLASISFVDAQIGRIMLALEHAHRLQTTRLLCCGRIMVGIWEKKKSRARTRCGNQPRASL